MDATKCLNNSQWAKYAQQNLDNNKANLPSSDAQINTSKKELLVQPEIRKQRCS
jgi:hypothetical protein